MAINKCFNIYQFNSKQHLKELFYALRIKCMCFSKVENKNKFLLYLKVK